MSIDDLKDYKRLLIYYKASIKEDLQNLRAQGQAVRFAFQAKLRQLDAMLDDAEIKRKGADNELLYALNLLH